MIKRTLGRTLLGLLVLTGFAGTMSEDSLSKSERKYAISLMKESREFVMESIKGLSDAQLDFKESPEKWSVRECVFHIATSEKMLWSFYEKTMKGAANPEKRKEIKVTDEQFVKMLTDRTNKVKTNEAFEPKNSGYKSLLEATEDFKKNRQDHIKHIKNSTEDMRNHVLQMPFGWIDCYQLCLMIAAHSTRHTQQINEVKAATGFPAK